MDTFFKYFNAWFDFLSSIAVEISMFLQSIFNVDHYLYIAIPVVFVLTYLILMGFNLITGQRKLGLFAALIFTGLGILFTHVTKGMNLEQFVDNQMDITSRIASFVWLIELFSNEEKDREDMTDEEWEEKEDDTFLMGMITGDAMTGWALGGGSFFSAYTGSLFNNDDDWSSTDDWSSDYDDNN